MYQCKAALIPTVNKIVFKYVLMNEASCKIGKLDIFCFLCKLFLQISMHEISVCYFSKETDLLHSLNAISQC